MNTPSNRTTFTPPVRGTGLTGLLCAALLAFTVAAPAQVAVTNSTPGNSTWTCPANVYSVQVEATGGGGASGNAGFASGSIGYECTGGGAGGSYVRYTVNVTPGSVYNFTVGAGGLTNSLITGSNNIPGNPGGSSYFGNTSPGSTNGALVCAVGGAGGLGTTNGGTSSARIVGIAGGIATTNGNIPLYSTQPNFADYPGTSGGTSTGGGSANSYAGAGGAGAGPSGNAGGGAGGPGLLGGGTSQAGTNGFAPGGGAGGAANATLKKTGGNGGAGRVVLTYTASSPAAANSTVAANPLSIPADSTTTATITVTLNDTNGNAISGKTVSLASNRGATDTIAPASAVSSAAGVATFTVKSASGGVGVFTATDTTDSLVVSQTASVTFVTAIVTIDHFVVTPSVASATAGQLFSATVRAYSPTGPITDASADGLAVLLTSSGAAQFDANGDGVFGDASKLLTNGTFTINVTDLKAESITLTASLGTNTGTSASVSIAAGAVAQLQLLLPGETATPGVAPGKTGTPTARTAGTGFSVTVNAVDTNWNVAASSDVVSLTAGNDANAILPANTALSGGSVALSVTNALAGSGRTLIATDVTNGGITASTSPAYSVVPGAVAKLLLLAPGETATFGVAPGKTGSPSAHSATVGYSVTVDAVDAFYNLVTSAADSVAVTSSAGGDTLPAATALVSGTKIFSLTNNTVGSVTLTATNVTQGNAVATGSSTVSVTINSTTTAIASSANPANEGSPITFTATVSGAGLKTGMVTFKNGTAVIGTAPVAGNTAALTTSGGAGTYAITAVYNGDANNSGSTSSALSQGIQVGSSIANPAAMEDGFDYALIGSMPITSQIPGGLNWACTSDIAANASATGNLLLIGGDIASTSSPQLKPLPNLTTNVPAHLWVNRGATDRELLRNIGNAITSGSAYFSFLISNSVTPSTAGAPMATMLASNVNNGPYGNDPVTLYGRVGSDSTHYNLGIRRLGGSISWAAANLAEFTTHLVVLKYTFGGDDALYLDPTPGNPEPAPDAVATTGTNAEPANIGTILFYEAGSTYPIPSDGTWNYDVMRVDANWYNVTPPVGASGLGAAHLAFSPAPQTLTIFTNSSPITVTLLDQSNQTFTAAASLTVNLNSSSLGGLFVSSADGTTVISNLTIAAGSSSATFLYRDSVAGNPTISGTSGLLTAATQTETINPPPGALDHFVVTPSVGTITAGGIFTATVQAYDSNNLAIVDASLNGIIVTLSSSGLVQFDANGDGTFGDNTKTLVNGSLTANVRDLKAETFTLSASVGDKTGTSTSIATTAGAVAQLQLLLPGETATPGAAPGQTGSPTAQTAGVGFAVTVRAVDTNWNVAAASDTIQITGANDANVILPPNANLTAGAASVWVTNILAGAGRTLTATDISNGAITASVSPGYAVVANHATRLLVLAPGETATYGSAPGKTGTPSHQIQTGGYALTVNALDAYYNLAANNTDPVQITSTDGAATLPANAALVGGAQTFLVVNNALGVVTDTAADVANGAVASGASTLTIDAIPRYRSVQSGNWGDIATWQTSTDGGSTWNPATLTPSSSLTALVEITNGITVTVASSVAVNRTIVDAGGTLTVSAGVTLTVVSGAAPDLDVYGALSNAGTITVVNPAAVVIRNGATYYHNQDGGAIVTATWETNSTCAVTGWLATTSVSATTGLRQSFGNFTWNSPSQTSTLSFGSSPPTTFKGNFNVLSTGSGVLALCLGATVNLNIGGDVNINGGTLYGATSGGGTETVNVAGNVNVSAGALNLEANLAGSEAVTWNLAGNLNVTGGTLTGTSTNAWPVIAFVKAGTQQLSVSGAGQIASTSTIDWVVTNSATLDLGTNVVNGVGMFTVARGAGLMTASANGFAGNLALPKANLNLSTAGNYTYDGTTAQSGDAFLPTTVAGLTVNNNQGLILNSAETATNLNLIGSSLTGNISLGGGTFAVSGLNATVIGNVALNASTLVLVASNNLPELTVQGGALTFSGGGIGLTLLGSSLPQGSYLLVNANNGGSVAGTLPNLVTVNGNGLLAGLTGTPQITGGNLYLSVIALYPGFDAGAGFFGGENLITTNAAGLHLFAWSSANPSQSIAAWSAEGALNEQPLNDGTGRSYYSLNVNPVASPTYYVIGTTNGGPFNISPVPVVTVTTPDFASYTVSQSIVAISATGVLNLVPAPVLSAGLRVAGGAFQFQLSGGSGLNYSIWASTNLVNWTVIGTGTFGGAPVTFTDTDAGNYPIRFYRLTQP